MTDVLGSPEPVPQTPVPPPPPRASGIAPLLHPLWKPLVILGAHLLVFTVARLILYLAYRSDFESLSGGQVAHAFLRGLRFDASIIFTLLGIPLGCLMLPFGWAQKGAWQKSWGWAGYALLIGFAFVLGVDLVYYGYVHRHVGPEATFLTDAFSEVAGPALKDYFPGILLFLGAAGGVFWLWRRLLRRPPSMPGPFRWRALLFASALALMYIGHRGTLENKRTKIVHAFVGVPPSSAYLSLNGPFTALHSIYDRRPLRTDFMPPEEAIAETKRMVFSPGETAPNPGYPLLRARAPRGDARPNVVVIMLEGWDAFYMDSIRKEMGHAPLGLSPCFDALSREGVLLTRFYAAGQKSMDGLSALLCGFPTLPHSPYIGRGMEQSSLSFLGRAARREGYETFFLQNSTRDSFRCDAIAPLAGFGTYLGAEDLFKSVAPPIPGQGTPWDHQLFEEANRRFAAARKPFLGFLFTTSTHFGFGWPPEWKPKLPANSLQKRYLNSLHYADSALGRFFDAAKKDGTFESTVFVLAADHTLMAENASADDPATLHHIPGLILAPGLKPAVERGVTSQLDVFATVVELAGWTQPHATFGRSLLDSSAGPDRGAVCVEGDLVVRIEDGGWVAHDLRRRVSARKTAATGDLDAIERRLLAFIQTAAALHRENRLCPPE